MKMITKKTILVAAMSVLAANTAMADKMIIRDVASATTTAVTNAASNAKVRAEVGTTGYGAAVVVPVTPKVDVAVGYNGGSLQWRESLSNNGVKYDINDIETKNAYVNAEIKPFNNSFHVAVGAGYIDNDYDMTVRRTAGSDKIKLNDVETNFTSVNGKVNTQKDFAPYVGVGYSPSFSELGVKQPWAQRVGVFGQAGVYYTGSPKATLTGVGGTAADQVELKKAQDNLNNEDKFKWSPVAKVGLSYRF